MSGIYIKSMEMPKDGSFEVLVVHDNGIVTKGFFPNENEYTKAIFIPDHGRLIDANVLITASHYDDHDVCVVDLDDIINAPTIIPVSEEGE